MPDTAQTGTDGSVYPSSRGERVISAPTANGRALWIATMIPTPEEGLCSTGGGRGFLNAIDVFTGTNPSRFGDDGDTQTFIDVDGDGDGDDRLNPIGGGEPGEDEGFLTSVDLGNMAPGRPRVGDLAVCVSGSNAEGVCVRPAGQGGGEARRVNWREILDNGG